MHPNENEEVQQALYYLNNRHRLKMQDMPQYLKALDIARKHGLEESNGNWYLPADDINIDKAC